MKFQYCTLDDVADARDCVVVIDVLRAYTTAAVAIAGGVAKYELVADADTAKTRRLDDPKIKLMGESGGVIIDGFDLPNSPTDVAEADLAGASLVHRSSAGTQGAVRTAAAKNVFAASFVVANATVKAIQAAVLDGDDASVTFCVTGFGVNGDGDEDRACGEYIEAVLREENPDPQPYLDRVRASYAGQKFVRGENGLPKADLPFAMQLDHYDFAMVVEHRSDRVYLHRSMQRVDERCSTKRNSRDSL